MRAGLTGKVPTQTTRDGEGLSTDQSEELCRESWVSNTEKTNCEKWAQRVKVGSSI